MLWLLVGFHYKLGIFCMGAGLLASTLDLAVDHDIY